MSLPELSIAVPMFNEEEGVDMFFGRVEGVLASMGLSYEIVCVNDGSSDGTLAALLRHRERNPRVVVVDLSRNFGKDIALTAAIDTCVGMAVVPMDADLQDPPEILPRLVEKWKEGYEMVVARRMSRESDTLLKRASARWFYSLFNKVSTVPIPADVGDFRLMDRRVVDALKQLPEKNRFMKGLFAWVGFRQATVDYVREARASGSTKFNYWKLWNFALDGFVSFSNLPLRVWSYLGAAISLGALVYAIYLVVRTVIFGRDVPGYPSIMVSILFMGGVQLISLGVIGEYLSRIFNETKRRPLYLTRSVFREVSGPEQIPQLAACSEPVKQVKHFATPQVSSGPSCLSRLFSSRSLPLLLLVGSIIGAAVGFYYLRWTNIAASANSLKYDIEGDRLNGNTGLNYYVQDQWRFPLYAVENLNDDAGANIIYTDSIPLIAPLLKAVYRINHKLMDPYGFWLWACFILQGAAMAYLMWTVGQRGYFQVVCAALLGVMLPALLFRQGHVTLCSHFLLILAIAFYLRSRQSCKLYSSGAMFIVLCLVSLLVHGYLWSMVMALAAAAFMQAVVEKRMPLLRAAMWLGGLVAATALVMFVAGYIPSQTVSSAGGMGYYSMNVLSPVVPQLSWFFPKMPMINATGGQYEGFNYLGLGILILIAYTLAFHTAQAAGLVKRNWALAIACLGMTLFALSNVVWFGHVRLLTINLPAPVDVFLSNFRSSGRYFWPMAYVLIAGGLVILFRRPGRGFALTFALAVVIIQFLDQSLQLRALWGSPRAFSPDRMEYVEGMDKLIGMHPGVRIYPEYINISDYSCRRDVLRVIHLASLQNKSVSTAYFSRTMRNEPTFDQTLDALFSGVNRTSLLVFAPPFSTSAVELITGQVPVRAGNILVVGNVPGWRDAALKCKGFSSEPALPVKLGLRYGGNDMKPWVINDLGNIPEAAWVPGNNTDIVFTIPQEKKEDLKFEINLLPHVQTDIVVEANGHEIHRQHLTLGDFRTISFVIPNKLLTDNGSFHLRLHVNDAPSPLELGVGQDQRKLGLLIRWFVIE